MHVCQTISVFVKCSPFFIIIASYMRSIATPSDTPLPIDHAHLLYRNELARSKYHI